MGAKTPELGKMAVQTLARRPRKESVVSAMEAKTSSSAQESGRLGLKRPREESPKKPPRTPGSLPWSKRGHW